EDLRHAGLQEKLHRSPRRAAAKQSVDLLENPGRRALGDLHAMDEEGGVGLRLHLEAEPRGELDGSEDPHWILPETNVRIADGADQASFEVRQATDVVGDVLGLDVIEETVDREVAPARVLLGGAEDVVAADEELLAFLRLDALARVRPEGRGLDDLRSEEDVG